jgi:hypothetical protein
MGRAWALDRSPMSALGQEQTFPDVQAMSALPPKRTLRARRQRPLARISEKHTGARQNNPDFGELARLSIDFD